jgi:anti-sigma factor RsiW
MINEDNLQAYVDDRLDASHSLLVEQYLEQNPGTAARIADDIEQSHALQATFANIVVKPTFVSTGESKQDTTLTRRDNRPGWPQLVPFCWQSSWAEVAGGLYEARWRHRG